MASDVVVADIGLAASTPSGPDVVVADVTLAATTTRANIVVADITLSALGATSLEPYRDITIPGGPWTQTAGTTVTLTNGNLFTTPPTMNGDTLTFTDGSGSAVSFAIRPHTYWAIDSGGTWQPVPLYEVIDTPAPDPNAMPNADISAPDIGINWKLLYTEDFLTDVPLGGIYPQDPSLPGDDGRLDAGCPAYAPYNSSFKVKSVSPNTDTIGQYNSKLTSSIQNSVFDIWLHTNGTQPVTGAIKPWLPASDVNYMTYGRIAFRMRATGIVGNGSVWRAVALLINNNQWVSTVEGWSEWDMPEARPNGNVGGFYHPTHPIGTADSSATLSTSPALLMSDWHTYVVEWFPYNGAARGRWFVDSQMPFDRTDRIPVAPMKLGWQIQVGTNNTTPAPTDEAHIQIDWIVIWAAQPIVP